MSLGVVDLGEALSTNLPIIDQLFVQYNDSLPYYERVYRQDGRLVSLDNHGIVRDLDLAEITYRLGNAITFIKNRKTLPEPDVKIGRFFMNRLQLPPGIPVLRFVFYGPTFSPQGKLLLHDGFDYASGIMVVAGYRGKSVSPTPSMFELQEAWERLKELLKDFNFATDDDRAAAFGLLFTIFVRPMTDTCYLTVINAPQPLSGKSLLSEIPNMIYSAHSAAKFVFPNDDAETERVAFSKLRSVPPFVLIDNLDVTLDSPFLASVLTEKHKISSRVMRTSESPEVEHIAVWVANGNNVVVGNDMIRRIVTVNMEAAPRDRPLPDLPGYIEANRDLLRWSILTIISGWIAAGGWAGRTKKPSFDKMAAIIGGIVEFCGLPSTFLSRQPQVEEDTMTALIELWAMQYGSTPIAPSTFLSLCHHLGEWPDELGSGVPTPARAGRFLQKYRGAIYCDGNYKLLCERDHHTKNYRYWLKPLKASALPSFTVATASNVIPITRSQPDLTEVGGSDQEEDEAQP